MRVVDEDGEAAGIVMVVGSTVVENDGDEVATLITLLCVSISLLVVLLLTGQGPNCEEPSTTVVPWSGMDCTRELIIKKKMS